MSALLAVLRSDTLGQIIPCCMVQPAGNHRTALRMHLIRASRQRPDHVTSTHSTPAALRAGLCRYSVILGTCCPGSRAFPTSRSPSASGSGAADVHGSPRRKPRLVVPQDRSRVSEVSRGSSQSLSAAVRFTPLPSESVVRCFCSAHDCRCWMFTRGTFSLPAASSTTADAARGSRGSTPELPSGGIVPMALQLMPLSCCVSLILYWRQRLRDFFDVPPRDRVISHEMLTQELHGLENSCLSWRQEFR